MKGRQRALGFTIDFSCGGGVGKGVLWSLQGVDRDELMTLREAERDSVTARGVCERLLWVAHIDGLLIVQVGRR